MDDAAEAQRSATWGEIGEAIADATLTPTDRDALLAKVAAWQAEHVRPFAKLCAARRARFDAGPDGWPAVPTDVFRFTRVAAHAPELDVRVFRTSGTTSGQRGEHALRSLALYDLAAERCASRFLFPTPAGREPSRVRLAMLAPTPEEAPDSSLSYMLRLFEDLYGSETAWCWTGGALDVGALREALDASVRQGEPLAILGTSFALVHADDSLGAGERWTLPAGSRVMPTGGFKGRSREVDPAAMREVIANRFGVPSPFVIGEYGMTEMSSQGYEIEGALHLPHWVRATPVDPETLRAVPDGEVGILRIDDLANLDGAVSIQTADLARRDGDRLVLLGRAPGATPRGCSLAIEEAIEGRAT